MKMLSKYTERRLAVAEQEWVRSFGCEDMRVLIICRGPVRKEAIDVFREMGVQQVGMLLSEKDSIVYTNALAPELRIISPKNVHRVRDYSGIDRDERNQRIQEIIYICREHGYDYVFAGYGFMAEDEALVSALESAGLQFVGPCSNTVRAAGRKDEAKRTALEQQVSTTPGVQDLTARSLLSHYPNIQSLKNLATSFGLPMPSVPRCEDQPNLLAFAELVLEASYRKGVDILSVEQITEQLIAEVEALFTSFPGYRIRLKAIGGGGGKGQRILQAPEDKQNCRSAAMKSAELYREILSEVKAGGVGDNKNILLELNIEQTRHHEVQLLGNGTWCVSLGGRDCSLQMHEQKLLEVSLTQESLQAEIDQAKALSRESEAEALGIELRLLRRMEEEAERFGLAVGLDSASTFECIVERGRHYFMEVNTRIQVEHRVSELCYGLRFVCPDDPNVYFDVNSIVEAMALIARHKSRLPSPRRIRRNTAAVEARLNATDGSLSPHAGGVMEGWSTPLEDEIRDEQGICIRNPDTNQFIRYQLAGAYDSNIALLVTTGEDRQVAFEKLCRILRNTELHGEDLATNLSFHQGLVSFLLGTRVYAQPTTRFVGAYLAQVGLLKVETDRVDLAYAGELVLRSYIKLVMDGGPSAVDQIEKIFSKKKTLIERPLMLLFEQPHRLSAWLSELRSTYSIVDECVQWNVNPLEILRQTYLVLRLDPDSERPPAYQIWPHDAELLDEGEMFYRDLGAQLGTNSWVDLCERLREPAAPHGMTAETWQAVLGAHLGHQAGLELFALPILAAHRAGFFELRVNNDLSVPIPARLNDPALQEEMRRVLAPPPVAASGNEIVAATGGMYYAREAPGQPPMVRVGDHVEVGQPIYIIEVMKMFNKIKAAFSGVVEQILIETDGMIVKKGQPLFVIRPDNIPVVEDNEARVDAKKTYTQGLLKYVLRKSL
ncbi:MAG: biotin carboxylase [Myxococcales bacterium]|nr:biotin carboxylase [Myxococcales bacterium]